MLLVLFTEKTPLKFVLPAEFVVGTPVIKTVTGMPGTIPVSVPVVVTVTMPEVSEMLLIGNDVEGNVTSTPRRTPKPPGVT